MKRWATISTMFGVFVIGLLMVLPAGQAADMSKAKAAEYILATAKAARTVYVKGVIADAKKAGVKLSEDWVKDDHSIMLPAQFILKTAVGIWILRKKSPLIWGIMSGGGITVGDAAAVLAETPQKCD